MCASRYLLCSLRMHFQSQIVCSSTTDHAEECNRTKNKASSLFNSLSLLVNDDDQVELDEWDCYSSSFSSLSLATGSSSASVLLLLRRQTTFLASVCLPSSVCFFVLLFLLLPLLLTFLPSFLARLSFFRWFFATLKTVNSHEHSPVDLLVGRQSTFTGWG